MITQSTPYFAIPLPHPSNQLQEDIVRLRAALGNVDTVLHWAAGLLASNDPMLASIQNLADASKALSARVGWFEPASSSVATYDADGRVTILTETLSDGRSRIVSLGYATSGLCTTETVTLGTERYRTTYTYDANGRLVSSVRGILL